MTGQISIAKGECPRRNHAAALAAVTLLSVASVGLADSGNGGRKVGMKAEVKREGNRVWIEGVPRGGSGNSYARGLEILLKHGGTPVEYDTIMGDTGLAFIISSEEGGPLIEGAVDVGWWPMVAWAVNMRLEFVGRACGREFRYVSGDDEVYRKDAATHYRDRFKSEVETSVTAGNPLLAEHDVCFVVTGYDDGTPPLLGDWALRDKVTTTRIEGYPWGLIVADGVVERMDRREADLAALRHAVALAHDTPQVTVPVFFREWQRIRGRFTGQKSFALWAAALRDTEHLGQARWHANMVRHLGINRRSAVAYLRAMAGRHGAKRAEYLNAAADLYEKALGDLNKADTGDRAMTSKSGRESLAKLVESVAAVEQ